MRFTDDNIDIPDPLIRALSSNLLVIFVGAGVSGRAYPKQRENTYYPLFKELVHQIAYKLGKTLSSEENRNLNHGFADRILGKWQHEGSDVHTIAAEILQENENEQRTSLHRAIIRLFSRGSDPKIVTTNFDNLLCHALQAEGLSGEVKWKTYEAPSLPPAHRFGGVCYLHGRVTNPQEMVLTDKDIGQAYMDEGWALRFAHSLFKEFHVLFLGYRLEDPPLRYLSLALEGSKDKDHWSLIPKPRMDSDTDIVEGEWRRRGVIPIWFQAIRKDFRGLERTIDAWSKDNRRGYVDRRNLLYELARSNPSQLPPHNLDRAKYFLSEPPELLRDFARSDLVGEWFERLIEWGHLDVLLKGAGDVKEADVSLAQRLTEWLLDKPDEWMVKLIQYRETIDPTLVEILFRRFEENDGIQIDVNDLRKLIEFFRVVIERDHTKIYSHWMEKVFLKLIEAGVFADAIWLFTTMTHVHTRVKKGLNYRYDYAKLAGEDTSEIPRYTLEFEVDFINQSLDHRARQYIKKVFLPNIREVGYPLIRALTSQFYATRITLKRTGNENYTHYFRSTIEPNKENVHMHEAQHFFIDTLRDLFEALLSIDPEQARKIFEEWREIDDVFFKRLSLHAARILLERKKHA